MSTALNHDDVKLYGEFTAHATRQTWSLMTARVESRKAFITSLTEFMKQHGFQGVELDWEYPSAADRGGSTNDAANFVALVQEMRVAWNKNYGISVTLPPDSYLRGFNAKGMEQHVDFFNYLSYDLRGPIGAGSVTTSHTDIREIEKDAAALWTAQVDPKKVNLGLSKAGRGYTLSDPKTCSHSNCPVSGTSKPGPCSNEAGLMSNVEINDVIKAKGLKPQLVAASMSKEITWDDQWIGYDDDETFKLKTDWAAENCFGGTTLWSLDMDSGEGSGNTPDGGGIVVPPPGGSTTSARPSVTSSAKPGQPVVPILPIPLAPGKSTASGSSSTSKPVSSGTSLTQTASGQTPAAAALVIPGIATIPAPTVAADSLVAVGAVAVAGLVPLAATVQKSLSEGQKAVTNLAKSDSPKSDDAVEALGILAGSFAAMQILSKQASMLDINSLPADAKPIVQKLKTSLPSMISGTRDTITSLTQSIKDPTKVNKDEIKKADMIMGEQGSVFKQIAPVIMPLIAWKLPKGSNDVVLPGILTLPSPTLGDLWKGTTIPGTLSVPSPTTPWEPALLLLIGAKNAAAAAGAAGAAGAGGGGGGGGGLLSALLNLAKQAESAVAGAADAMNALTSLCRRDAFSCPITFNKLSNALSQLLAATEDVGGLGAGLDAIELDAFPPADISRVVSVQNANRNLFNTLKGTLSDVARIVNNPPAALQLLKKHSPAYVAGGAVLTLLAKSNGGSIGALPWNAVGAKKGRNEYFLVTVPNTPVKVFNDFIRGLPDKGIGPQRLYDWPRQYQTYVGKMTREEAAVVNRDGIVAVIGANSMIVVGEPATFEPEASEKDRMSSRSNQRSNETRLESRVDPPPSLFLERRAPLAYQLQMLSFKREKLIKPLTQNRHKPENYYLHDRTSGQGATIYMMGRGFKLTSHQEFVRQGIANGPDGFYEIHPDRFDPFAPAQPAPPNANGDMYAALAMGDTLGAANKATLIGVELNDESGVQTLAQAYEAWKWIVSDVKSKNLQGKAVTSYTHPGRVVTAPTDLGPFSTAWQYRETFENNHHVDYKAWGLSEPSQGDFFLPLLVDLWMADIVTVFGGGDHAPRAHTGPRAPNDYLGSWSPQRFANKDNAMIVVGGVSSTGLKFQEAVAQLSQNNLAPVRNRRVGAAPGQDPFLTGELTVYALAEQVDVVDTSDPQNFGKYTHA
ncbi:MAG: hypothetical protein Q9168_003750 [Polycauliona sp. 1 TL-2023]